MAAESGYGVSHASGQAGAMIDSDRIKVLAFSRIQIQSAAKIDDPSSPIADNQREGNAGVIARISGYSGPGSSRWVRRDVIDPTGFTSPRSSPWRALSGFRGPPRIFDALEKIEADARLSYWSNSSLGIVFTITDPNQTEVVTVDQRCANGLQGFRLALDLKKRGAAIAECGQSPVEAAQPVFCIFVVLVCHNSTAS